MVDILTGLVRAGVTVLISIHQPRADVFRMLTRVLILSGEGTTVYSGPTRLAAAHFEGLGYSQRDEGAVDVGGGSSLHIADYVLDLVIRSSHDEVDRMVQGYLSSEVAAKEREIQTSVAAYAVEGGEFDEENLIAIRHKASFCGQLRLLCGRLLRKSLRHPMHIVLTILVTLLMSLITGCMFFRTGIDTPGIQVRMR